MFTDILAVLACLGVAPAHLLALVALLRSRSLDRLSNRLDRIEDEMARLRRALRNRESTGPAAAPTTEAEAPLVVEQVEEGPLTALPVVPVPPAPRPEPRAAPNAEPSPIDFATLESWVGQHGLGWAAVVVLLFAGAFFLKYAFDNAWIGALGRVGIGALFGALLCLAGLHQHRHGRWLFSQMLSAAGAVLLYLATYAAFGYYHLLPQGHAAVFLVILVAEIAALAVLANAPAIALMAVIGGLLNPLLLHTDRDQYRNLFTYLAVLDAGVVGLALFRHWRLMAPLALLGTQGLFWAWYSAHYHPEKLAAALGFQIAVFALFLAHDVLAPLVRPRPAGPSNAWRGGFEDLSGLVANAFLFALAAYVLLEDDYRTWLGTWAVGLAVIYTGLAWVVLRRRPEDARLVLGLVATGLAFVAVAFALEGEAGWISLGWAVEGAALSCFGLRIRAAPLRALGAALLVLAAGRLLFVDTPWTGREPFIPVFNRYGLPGLAISACLLIAGACSIRFLKAPNELDRAARWGAGLGGLVLAWFVLSFEVYQFFSARAASLPEEAQQLGRAARASLSVFWTVYAALVLALGFALRTPPVRYIALGLFGLTLAKVFLIDMAGLSGFYRVAAFFVLAVMLGAAAWGYQKLFERVKDA